jgi:RNA-directed DNA polymerase
MPTTQNDHFKASHLAEVFRTKIAKSQATGKDGIRIDRFHDILEFESNLIERKVTSNSYTFTRFKERLILRGYNRNPRQISIPTVRDRLTLRTICQVLHIYIPETRGLAPHTLVKQVVEAVREGDHFNKSFVRLDVRDFFPSISHSILKRELRHFKVSSLILRLCVDAIRTPTGSIETPSERGVPQGLSISNALSAVFMLRFDSLRKKEFKNYFRYVDDILLIIDTPRAEDALKTISRSLSSRGLIVHKKGVEGKTEISPVSKGIDFLGYRIGVNKISIRSSSYKRMFKNILKVITDFRYQKDIDRLIFRLNLKITGCVVDEKRRGWMMFFSYTEDLSQLAFLDHFVRKHLLRVGFPSSDVVRISRFIKSHHEIRFNINESTYIPNFDQFSQKRRADVISALTRNSVEEVLAWDASRIDEEFSRLISREVHDLEQDIGSFS